MQPKDDMAKASTTDGADAFRIAWPDAPPESLSEVAYRAILERIVTLRLPPAAVIEEQALMRELGVGRTPVREAVNRLSHEGLVMSIPRRGRVVSEINIKDLSAITEVRVEFEGLAARLSSQRATESDRTMAQQLIAELEDLDRSFSMSEYVVIDQRVHRFVHTCAHNAYLEWTLKHYTYLALRIWFMHNDSIAAFNDVRDSRPGPGELIVVLAGIIEGDAARAEVALRGHILRFQHEFASLLLGTARSADMSIGNRRLAAQALTR